MGSFALNVSRITINNSNSSLSIKSCFLSLKLAISLTNYRYSITVDLYTFNSKSINSTKKSSMHTASNPMCSLISSLHFR